MRSHYSDEFVNSYNSQDSICDDYGDFHNSYPTSDGYEEYDIDEEDDRYYNMNDITNSYTESVELDEDEDDSFSERK